MELGEGEVKGRGLNIFNRRDREGMIESEVKMVIPF